MKNADMPAMPISKDLVLPQQGQTLPGGYPYGLTKREQLAAMAMQGLCAQSGYGGPDEIAKDAVDRADALLAELEKDSGDA